LTSFAIDVVLPEPLTPAISTTVGPEGAQRRSFSVERRRSTIRRRSQGTRSSPDRISPFFAASRAPLMRLSAASTPTSLVSRISSTSSHSAWSIRRPLTTALMRPVSVFVVLASESRSFLKNMRAAVSAGGARRPRNDGAAAAPEGDFRRT
jgi:hypothetical protein